MIVKRLVLGLSFFMLSTSGFSQTPFYVNQVFLNGNSADLLTNVPDTTELMIVFSEAIDDEYDVDYDSDYLPEGFPIQFVSTILYPFNYEFDWFGGAELVGGDTLYINLFLQPDQQYQFRIWGGKALNSDEELMLFTKTFTTGESLSTATISGVVNNLPTEGETSYLATFPADIPIFDVFDEGSLHAGAFALTDEEGNFTFSHILPGDYRILAVADLTGDYDTDPTDGDSFGFLDENADYLADVVFIEDSQQLTGLVIDLFEFLPAPVEQSKVRASQVAESFIPNSRLTAIFADHIDTLGQARVWAYIFSDSSMTNFVFLGASVDEVGLAILTNDPYELFGGFIPLFGFIHPDWVGTSEIVPHATEFIKNEYGLSSFEGLSFEAFLTGMSPIFYFYEDYYRLSGQDKLDNPDPNNLEERIVAKMSADTKVMIEKLTSAIEKDDPLPTFSLFDNAIWQLTVSDENEDYDDYEDEVLLYDGISGERIILGPVTARQAFEATQQDLMLMNPNLHIVSMYSPAVDDSGHSEGWLVVSKDTTTNTEILTLTFGTLPVFSFPYYILEFAFEDYFDYLTLRSGLPIKGDWLDSPDIVKHSDSLLFTYFNEFPYDEEGRQLLLIQDTRAFPRDTSLTWYAAYPPIEDIYVVSKDQPTLDLSVKQTTQINRVDNHEFEDDRVFKFDARSGEWKLDSLIRPDFYVNTAQVLATNAGFSDLISISNLDYLTLDGQSPSWIFDFASSSNNDLYRVFVAKDQVLGVQYPVPDDYPVEHYTVLPTFHSSSTVFDSLLYHVPSKPSHLSLYAAPDTGGHIRTFWTMISEDGYDDDDYYYYDEYEYEYEYEDEDGFDFNRTMMNADSDTTLYLIDPETIFFSETYSLRAAFANPYFTPLDKNLKVIAGEFEGPGVGNWWAYGFYSETENLMFASMVIGNLAVPYVELPYMDDYYYYYYYYDEEQDDYPLSYYLNFPTLTGWKPFKEMDEDANLGAFFENYDFGFDQANVEGVLVMGPLNEYFLQDPTLLPERPYLYLTFTNDERDTSETFVLEGLTGNFVSVETQSVVPESFNLGQNYPNPFNPVTRFSVTLPAAMDVEITVYNLLGQKVANLLSGSLTAGTHVVTFSGSSLPSGLYFYEVSTSRWSDRKTMILVK